MATDSRADRPTDVHAKPAPGAGRDAAVSPIPGPSRPAVGASGVVKRQHGGGRGTGPARAAAKSGPNGQVGGGDLVIGPGVAFTGRIRACDRLVVAGQVDAAFPGQCLEIRDGGSYRGEAHVRAAEIHGAFEGNLTVEGKLVLGATARVRGAIRYDTLEIAAGGELRGDVDRMDSHASGGVSDEHGDAIGEGPVPAALTLDA